MDNSIINPLLLSSSAHLENVEQLIRNLENTTKSFSSLSSSAVAIDDPSLHEDLSIKRTTTDQDEDCVWDDQYDMHSNYRLAFTNDRSPQMPESRGRQHRSANRRLYVPHAHDSTLSNEYQIRSRSNPPPSSTSWRQMKESQRTTTSIETKETRPLSPMSLYQIFQQKSHPSQQQKSKSSYLITTDQAIQTSPSTNSPYLTVSKSSVLHKSLPDLSFVSQYTKELPRSRATSPASINAARTTPSPTLIQQQKQDSDRPRTLKSIKRYKNSKHSTEPLGVFYSPQLRRTFAAVSTSKNTSLKMKIPVFTPPESKKSTSHRSEHDLCLLSDQAHLTDKSMSFSEAISQHCTQLHRPTLAANRTRCYGEMRRCQTDIIVVDPVLHLHSFTDSPPNEFSFQPDEDPLMEQSHINSIPNTDDEPVPSITIVPPSPLPIIEKETPPAILDDLVDRVNSTVKRLFEIKKSNQTFFLNNEQNSQLDHLLKNDLCPVIESILEHGRKDRKKINQWKIIETSIDQTGTPRVYFEAKQIAQHTSTVWLHKLQTFVFALLNKNELVNWLYYFTRQKVLLQRYYHSPDALILVAIPSTFNTFERMMTQLEKLTPLSFRLTFHPSNDDSMNASMISSKPTPRDWMMTISRRSFTAAQSNDTLRSTLSRKLNGLFAKTNPSQSRRPSSVVTTKLPRRISPSPSASHSVAPSVRTAGTFQSKIPRLAANVEKPKSTRYRSPALSSK